ncbi:MAG: hypothetical protein ACRD1L_03770 [Terriglobales bacterium]
MRPPVRRWMLAGFLGAGLGVAAAAPQAPANPNTLGVVVTALAPDGSALPPIETAQVAVRQGHEPVPVTTWLPCTGANARLDLALVLDDDTRNLGSGLDDLKHFIGALPPTTAVALVYLHTSTVSINQALTMDHAKAAQELRMPSGGTSSSPSPYGSLQALFAKWPAHPGRRREMILISDGQEHAGGNDVSNVTYQTAVADAVRSGVVVYTIFATGSPDNMDSGALGVPLGPAGRGFAALNSSTIDANNGVQNLAGMAEATGGQAYAQGNGTPPRLVQFLQQIGQRMNSQYILGFTPAPNKNGGLVGLKVEVKDSRSKITAPSEVFVPKR